MSRSPFVLAITTLLFHALGVLQAEDTVFLKNGDSRSGEIKAMLEEGIVFDFTTKVGDEVRLATRTLLWTNIDYIIYSPVPGELEALAKPSSIELRAFSTLWLSRLKLLSRPKSSAPRLGLLFAERLSLEGTELDKKRALEIFELIEEKAWDKTIRPKATQGRLQTMIRLNRVKEAMAEARRMAENADNPTAFLEAKHVLGIAEFDQLKLLEAENPRWELDDAVRPKRNDHFNQALDLFLHPFLFHGSEIEPAARGLLHAARVYAFAEDRKNAQLCAEDILKLYPSSSAAPEAKKLIADLPQPAKNIEFQK